MRNQSSFHDRIAGGQLFLVATPIGNLQDMTIRALETLKEVDLIAAEDTRQTRKLLSHYQIDKKLISHHEFNKQASARGIVELLKAGKSIALVSDAGMPAISDPGYELVQEATAADIAVIPIPGANAALCGLVASGLKPERFVFLGFLPREKKAIRHELERVKNYPETLICYEAPHRIVKTLREILTGMGNRRICLAREITKKHEQFLRGTVAEGIEWLEEQEQIRGEFTIVIEGSTETQKAESAAWWEDLQPTQHVEKYIEQGFSSKEAIKKTAEDRDVAKREIYNHYHKEDEGCES
jgi:16S rRNA (cytidine1402-2'-O)-methyltransferase